MSTRLVTGTILNPATGAPWAAAEVKFALDSTGVTLDPAGIYPPKSVAVVTDENGQLGAEGAGVALWANAEGLTLTKYHVSIGGKFSFFFRLPPGVDPIDLSVLKMAGLTTIALDDPFIAVVEALIAAADQGGGAWGDITGTLADQTDLQAALDAEAAARAAADSTKAPLASPAFTGTPTAPTPLNAINTTQLATTAFVHALLTDLIGTAPANLDTLQEIAAQLATDESAVAALITAVSLKANISSLAAVAFSGAKADVGLGNVDNTSDANKPVSTLQAAADALKANLAGDNTFTGRFINSVAGALSAPAVFITGAPVITGGTGTTTKPLVLIETAGATSTVWSLIGTMLGVNAPSGFAGSLIEAQINGSSKFGVDGAGSVMSGVPGTGTGKLNFGGNSNLGVIATSAALAIQCQNNLSINTYDGSAYTNVLTITGNSATRLVGFGGLTSATPALKRVGNALAFRRGDDTVATFATLPAASAANEGAICPVSDSTTAIWGATITGGGSNHVLAYSNGTNWTVAGK